MNRETAETKKGERVERSDTISLTLPSKAEYVLIARLMVAQVGQMAGFGPEEVYDLKLAVTEAATNVIRHAAVGSFEIEYAASPGVVRITVSDAGGGFDVEGVSRSSDGVGGFGLSVIRDLVDEMEIDSAANGTRLRMIRRTSLSVDQPEG
jgi:serine/threonine-protein kinase RsbW